MLNPCTFYGRPCEVGTEGNCVCRKKFFERSELDELLPADFGSTLFAGRDAEAFRDETDRLALGGDPEDAY
jgi:hypothetical protein